MADTMTADQEIGMLREMLSDALADGIRHQSDCAIYSAPAETPGPCNCGTGTWKDLCESLVGQLDHVGCTCTFPDDECCAYAKAETWLSRSTPTNGGE